MMKRFSAIILAILVLIAALAGCNQNTSTNTNTAADGSEKYDKVTIKFALSGTEQAVDYFTAEYFRDRIAEESGGRITVQIYPNNILAGGSMPEAINLLTQGGAYEMGIFSSGVLGNIDPSFSVVQLPFAFDSYEEVSTYHDGTGGEWMKAMLEKYGLVYLGAEHNGLKQWTNNKAEKRTPDDFKNFKIRIPGGEVSNMIWRTLGADPVSMSWSETYTALQQGTVDGHENSYQTIYSSNIQEIQKYITEVGYQYDGYFMMYNANDFSKLSPDTQELIRKIGDEACKWGRTYLEDAELKIKEEMIAKGNVITVLTPEEKQVFIDKLKPVIEHFRSVYGSEALTAWGIE